MLCTVALAKTASSHGRPSASPPVSGDAGWAVVVRTGSLDSGKNLLEKFVTIHSYFRILGASTSLNPGSR